jgi:hypothetical protein
MKTNLDNFGRVNTQFRPIRVYRIDARWLPLSPSTMKLIHSFSRFIKFIKNTLPLSRRLDSIRNANRTADDLADHSALHRTVRSANPNERQDELFEVVVDISPSLAATCNSLQLTRGVTTSRRFNTPSQHCLLSPEQLQESLQNVPGDIGLEVPQLHTDSDIEVDDARPGDDTQSIEPCDPPPGVSDSPDPVWFSHLIPSESDGGLSLRVNTGCEIEPEPPSRILTFLEREVCSVEVAASRQSCLFDRRTCRTRNKKGNISSLSPRAHHYYPHVSTCTILCYWTRGDISAIE